MIQLQPQMDCPVQLEDIHSSGAKARTVSIRLEITNQPLQCRICLEQETMESAPSNPLIIPCKCTGSVSYVHVSCLNTWILKSSFERLQISTPKCQICLHPYSINKKCRPKFSFKDRRNDYLIIFLVCFSIFIVGIISLPVLYRATFQLEALRYILMGILISVILFVAICGGIYFKETFIEIRHDWIVQPYKEISVEPTMISLVTEQQPKTPSIRREHEELILPGWSSRSDQATAGNIARIHPL